MPRVGGFKMGLSTTPEIGKHVGYCCGKARERRNGAPTSMLKGADAKQGWQEVGVLQLTAAGSLVPPFPAAATGAILTAAIASERPQQYWWADPVGGIAISLYIMARWLVIVKRQASIPDTRRALFVLLARAGAGLYLQRGPWHRMGS